MTSALAARCAGLIVVSFVGAGLALEYTKDCELSCAFNLQAGRELENSCLQVRIAARDSLPHLPALELLIVQILFTYASIKVMFSKSNYKVNIEPI